jgi:hypothetical protein
MIRAASVLTSLSLALTVMFSSNITQATPAEVLIIRHGEKIDDNDPNLSPKGYKRAAALPALFMNDARFLEFGRPVAIYAGSPKHTDGSVRPLQTIQPTAKALGLKPITEFESKDYASMVADVMKKRAYNGKTVLISWPHDEIPDMAHEFGMKNKHVPDWKGSIFDRVWKIHFSSDGDVTSFEDVPQHVLPGDSAQ